MTDDEPPLRTALRTIPETRNLVAEELRAMAAAERRPYRKFAKIDPWIKNIWHAAADLLEARD